MKNKKQEENQRVGKPYFIDKFATIKPIYKILFLKFWVFGVSFFLAFMTTEAAGVSDILDQLAIMLILFGLLTEYVSNKIIVYMHREEQPTFQYLPFPINKERKKLLSLVASFAYAIIVSTGAIGIHIGLVQVFTHFGIPTLGWLLTGSMESMDPISMGLYGLIVDTIWFYLKKLVVITFKKKEVTK